MDRRLPTTWHALRSAPSPNPPAPLQTAMHDDAPTSPYIRRINLSHVEVGGGPAAAKMIEAPHAKVASPSH
ncbi:hypothetical protein AMTR_s00021p00206250 [Amborella trichopoda]|uniref:Uncharacterized protein n=1 Tax=Amborella trichopoda TaxID=13333 RepID=W1Q115_AMBTC|nr:hypothetical protein AMTR_s00021p00206250 [Amborella trichopoda]